MEKHGWLLWAFVPLTLFAAIWWLTPSPIESMPPDLAANDRSRPVPNAAEYMLLQSKADAACLCGRSRGSPWDEGCWADYRRSVARFNPISEATACMEESVALDCFGPEGENQLCVSTGREYGACSAAEEQSRREAARRASRQGCGG